MIKESIIARLRDQIGDLSPKLRQVALYIIDHHKEAAFLNASALAQKAGVSETTVTRLVYQLGFKGFPELREALHDHARTYMALPRYEPASSAGNMLGEVAAAEKAIIDETLLSISPELFNSAVGTLHEARRIRVVGTHYNAAPAAYCSYFLSATRARVSLIKSVGISCFTETQDSGPEDAVLAVSTARYPKDTHKILELFKAKGTPIIAITDSTVSPVAALADLMLVVPMKHMTFIDPFAGILVLAHALTTAVYMRDAGAAKNGSMISTSS